MFTPIKKIFTYIQKNASGSGLFGGINNAVSDAIEVEDCEELAKKNDRITTSANPREQQVEMAQGVSTTETVIIEDDIELQIKPSILINKPKIEKDKRHATRQSPPGTPTPTSSYIGESQLPKVESRMIFSKIYKVELADDELADFVHAPVETVDSEPETELVEDEVEDCVDAHADVDDNMYMGEDIEKTFLELDAFENKNIMVLNEDAEHNVSITSDNISEDPLAIDEFSLAENPLDTETNLSIVVEDDDVDDEDDDEDNNDEHDVDAPVKRRRRTSLWIDLEDGDEQPHEMPTGGRSQQLSSISSRKPLQQQMHTRGSASGSVACGDGGSDGVLEIDLAKTNSAEHHVETVDELRSDGGSDSGLGSETTALLLQSANISLTEASHLSGGSSVIVSPNQTQPPTQLQAKQKASSNGGELENTLNTLCPKSAKPLRSNLKRQLVEVDLVAALEVDENSEHGEHAKSSNTTMAKTMSPTIVKRTKRSINFDNVQVYYFPRQQGFNCVPTVGGCTLGMGARHIGFKTLTLAEHAAELRRAHRMQMQEVQPRGGSSSDETEESEEDYLSDGSGSDPDGESNGFLQPVTPKQRRALLKAAGVRKIDASEKIDCRDIRNSREICGCSCREFCDPETCACSQAGIKCQVDRSMFPCGCTREACGNTIGRVEFNPTRVRTHFIHTIMRLDLEQRQEQQQQQQQQQTNNLSYALTTNSSTSAGYYGHMQQPQSNYSSGYASPAYTPEAATPAHFYQTPQQQAQPSAEAAAAYVGAGTLPDLHTPPQYQMSVDSLDANLFVSGSNATPSYGELMQLPTYQNLSNTQLSNYYHHLHHPHHHHHHHNNNNHQSSNAPAYHREATTPAFSSCAVPSAPPFGIATTTTCTTTNYHPLTDNTSQNNNNNNNSNNNSSINSNNKNSVAMAHQCDTFLNASVVNCAPSLIITPAQQQQQQQHQNQSTISAACAGSQVVGNAQEDVNRFISLNSPTLHASSSRLSQINDLLRHNRNTTIALVAVSESPRNIGYALNHNGSNTTNSTNNSSHSQATGNASSTITTATASIDTPPIEDAHKHCLAFEQLTPTLLSHHPAPIVGVIQEAAIKSTTTPLTASAAAAADAATTQLSDALSQRSDTIIATLPASTTIRRIN